MCSFFQRASKKPPSPLHDIDFLLSPYQVKGDASDCQGWAHTCTCSMHGVGTNTQMYIWYTRDTKGKKEASTYKKWQSPLYSKAVVFHVGKREHEWKCGFCKCSQAEGRSKSFSSCRQAALDLTKSHFTHTRWQIISLGSWTAARGSIGMLVSFWHFEGMHEFCLQVWQRILVMGILWLL